MLPGHPENGLLALLYTRTFDRVEMLTKQDLTPLHSDDKLVKREDDWPENRCVLKLAVRLKDDSRKSSY